MRLAQAVAVALLAAWSSATSAVEVRLGAAVTGMELVGGVFPDAPTFNPANLDSVQGQIFFELPNVMGWRQLLVPRLELGGLVNLRGGDSYVHGGLGWHYPVFETPLFIETGIGVGFNNGVATGAVAPRRNLGCSFGVHYSYGIGANITDDVTLVARFQHLSHAYLCSGPNEGLNSLSMSVGYSF